MMGTIEGGWNFVWAAYAFTAVIVIGYSISVVSRLRGERRRLERARREEGS